MTTHNSDESTAGFLTIPALDEMLGLLKNRGYEVIGPTIDQDAIVYDTIETVDDLPRGWTDIQQPGSYRLERRDDDALFGYVVGPHSWKRYLFPPLTTVLTSERTESGWQMRPVEEEPPRYAFLGVRACELAAMAVQDQVFAEGDYVDPIYVARRQNALIIAVNCTQAAATCFCTSMNTGPRCSAGFDLALTELSDGFIVEIGSERGAELIAQLSVRDATPNELCRAAEVRDKAVTQIQRRLDTSDVHDLLLNNLEHPRWDMVASKCLSCANCTMVCPTCFCSTVDEVADLSTDRVDRRRKWDSCFNVDFSYMNGGVVRNSIRSRYRQWITHKLATWIDQFGTSGCVGCGRCITWCPVGIDLTEEVAALRKMK